MLALTQPEENQYIPPMEYAYLYEHRKPPPGVYVWLAAYLWGREPQIRVGWSKPQKLVFETSKGRRHGYVLAFNVGALVFQVFSDPWVGEFGPIGERREDTFIRAWPVPITASTWPPSRRLSEAGLDELGDARVFVNRDPPGDTQTLSDPHQESPP
jgi:hypothetical protein